MGVLISMVELVTFAGALGSIISIMVRIQDFSSMRNVHPSILFFIGFFKPMIGMAFALFLFAAINSGIIPVTVDPESEVFFFAALSFVAGFSERFVRDMIEKTEESIPAL